MIKKMILLIVPLVFLVVGIVTIRDYGTNWDEPFHFYRGQAYLHFFLTGKKDYSDLPAYPSLSSQCPTWDRGCNLPPTGAYDILRSGKKEIVYEDGISLLQKGRKTWRSFYQSDQYTYDVIVAGENGHPPLGGIGAATTNYIFYQKLHIMGDIESHHLFGILCSFLLVLGVFFFTFLVFGPVPSVFSSITLSAYPLFFSESHFNIKDPILASFFGITIIFFYFGIIQKKWKLIIASSVFFGLATGVKFNTIFLPIILCTWLFFFLISFIRKSNREEKKKALPVVVSLLIYPLVAGLAFYVLWPYLWSNPIDNLGKILLYYKNIGTGIPADMQNFLFHRWNTYPILWIIYTTPIPVILFAILGIYKLVRNLSKNNFLGILLLLWLFVPIIRVSWPNTVIYGGVRQIMEYVPALAIIAGIGVYSLLEFVKGLSVSSKEKLSLIKVFTAISFLALILAVYEVFLIHPNENVYFNQFIGGLSGAQKKNIPYWGNSYGNAYMQGINWINENAEPNAKLGLPLGTMGNIPKIKLRADIDFYNRHWSGPKMAGEYEMEMNMNWSLRDKYSFSYYDVYLNPVYEVKVDGVAILKIWKNDLAHTKPGFEKEKVYKPSSIRFEKGRLKVDLGKEVYLTRLTISHSNFRCQQQRGGYIAISEDGESWKSQSEPIDSPQVYPAAVGIGENNFVYLFAAKKARYVSLSTFLNDSCLFANPLVEVRGLEKLP